MSLLTVPQKVWIHRDMFPILFEEEFEDLPPFSPSAADGAQNPVLRSDSV